MSRIQCAWCSRLTSNPTMHIPPSEVTALEPSEPVPLCQTCVSETEIKPIPIMPLINRDRDIWDDVDDFVFEDAE